MTQETYRFAYDEANAELREIVDQFEQLQARKEQIEQVVKVLQAVMDDTAPEVVPPLMAESVPFLVQAVEQPQLEAHESYAALPIEPEPEPAYAGEQSADPFQRRIDNALRHGLGSRDSRILPRALNGLLSRA